MSIADRELWIPTEFFESRDDLAICDAISSGNVKDLKLLLTSGVELNRPGEFGMTVLYWAYVEEDLRAFKLLLEHGADPDKRLTGTFRWSHNGVVDCSKETETREFVPFFEGDTVLFSSLSQFNPQFCIAALKYSHNVNQLDRGGENLLHRFLQPGSGGSENLQAIIDAGVDLNAKGRYGATPCHLALSFTNPRLCMQLLDAGAEPGIRNDEGQDLADFLERKLSTLAQLGEQDIRLDPIIAWLSENYREIRWSN